MKKALLLLMFLCVLMPLWSAYSFEPTSEVSPNQRALTGDEPIQYIPYMPTRPGMITDSPGEIVGYTQYDFQSNGSTGTRIVVDAAGGKHFVWTWTMPYPAPRHIYYNYVDAVGNWLAPAVGVQVNAGVAAGFTQMAGFAAGNSAVAYHQATLNFVTYASENSPGGGTFTLYDPPDMLVARTFWPYIGVDISGRIHLVSTENVTGPQGFGYTNSTDGGVSWSALTVVDTVRDVSVVIATSPVSNRTAIVYANPIDPNSQTNNDVYYIVSEDGVTWDFANGKVNLTNYEGSIDSLRMYDDLDAVIDYNDDLQIVWGAGRLFSNGALSISAWLFHFNETTGMINQVAEQPIETWTCGTGAWNISIAKMSIGVSEENDLFATWTRFDTSDYSASGRCNGELYMSYSPDGTNWAPEINMTNSATPGCAAGECDSDHWSSLAEKVDQYLHLTYVNDKDAGGTPQAEGVATDNPIRYLAYPNPLYVAPVTRQEGLAESGRFTQIGVSNYGILGAYDVQTYTYNWNSTGAVDYEASFILGNSGSNMIIEYGIGTGTHGFRPRADLNLTDTFNPTAAFDDSALFGGVYVDYRGYGFTGAGPEDFFIHEYEISNTSLAPVTGLYAACYFDWDIGGTDVVTFDRPNNVIVQGPTAGPFYGVALVSGSVNTLMGVSNLAYIYNQQGWIGDTLYYYMNQNGDLMPTTYADMSSLVTFGPFDLLAGEVRNVAFATIGGASRADVSASAALAHETYSLFYNANIIISETEISHDVIAGQMQTFEDDFTISNNGGVPLEYTATNSLPWMTLGGVLLGTVPPGGSDSIDVTIDATGITPGTYYDTVVVVSNDPETPVFSGPTFTIIVGGAGCAYVVGDINGNGQANGIDVTFGVAYLKGGAAPPIDCGTPVGPCPQASPFFAAGDVNGNCAFNGIDITFYVSYLKGGQPALLFCDECPPAGGPAPAVEGPRLKATAIRISQ